MKRQTRFAAYMSTMLTLVVVVSPSTRADAPTCNQLEEVERLLASAGTDLRLTDIVAIAPDDIWAVGYQWDFQQRFTLTAHYDGVDWTVTPSPSPGDSPVSAGLNAVAAVQRLSVKDAFALTHARLFLLFLLAASLIQASHTLLYS